MLVVEWDTTYIKLKILETNAIYYSGIVSNSIKVVHRHCIKQTEDNGLSQAEN